MRVVIKNWVGRYYNQKTETFGPREEATEYKPGKLPEILNYNIGGESLTLLGVMFGPLMSKELIVTKDRKAVTDCARYIHEPTPGYVGVMQPYAWSVRA